MKVRRHRAVAFGIGLLFPVLLASATELAAEPVGLISISSDDDAAAAEAIFGTAYARVGNRFLVSVGPAQQALTNAAGLRFQTVLDDADPDGLYQIYDLDHPRAPEVVALDRFGELIDLGQGVRIMRLTRAEAASLSDSHGTRAVKLTDLAVPFFYPRHWPIVSIRIRCTHMCRGWRISKRATRSRTPVMPLAAGSSRSSAISDTPLLTPRRFILLACITTSKS
jgi:hypothetical protein